MADKDDAPRLSPKVAHRIWPFVVNDAAWGVLREIKDLTTDMGLERYSDETIVLAVCEIVGGERRKANNE